MTETPDFDAMYTQDPDPWEVETSWYERRKLTVTLAALPRERYATAWEPGSGPGLVSRALAPRVGRLVASDGSPVAVGLAETRLADLPHVEVVLSELPAVPLNAPVELVVAAEFLYYLPDLPACLEALWGATAPGGHLVFVHWAHQPHDARLSGAELHERIAAEAVRRASRPLVRHNDEEFCLDVYEVAR